MPLAGTDRPVPRAGTLPIAVVFLLGLCLAAGTATWWQNEITLDAEAEFNRSVGRLSAEIHARFRRPVDGLNCARGMYAAAGERVQREAFRAYVESRDLPNEFPGVRGGGFIQHVRRPGLNAFVATERADAAPGFAIRHSPAGGQGS